MCSSDGTVQLSFESSSIFRQVPHLRGVRLAHDSRLNSERGATLLEAAFSVVLFGSLLALANAIVSSESARQRNIALGLDLRFMTETAQAYVAGEYDELRSGLASLPLGNAIQSITMRQLASAGYLPESFLDGDEHSNSYGQSYRILVRGVNRADGDFPKATLSVSEIDTDGDGSIDAHLVNGEESDGELDVESLMVSTGGSPILPQHGNPAVAAAKTATAGFIQEDHVARGPYGNWEMNIQSFSSLSDYPTSGRFVALLSLSGYGVFGNGGHRPVTEFELGGNPFERCVGLSGNLLSECAGNNEIYTEVVFDSSDSNPNGYGKIENVFTIEMGGEVDSDADGVPDIHSAISDVSKISCVGGGPVVVSSGTLLIDCPTGRFSGGVEIAGDLDVAASATATRFLAGAIGNQDLTKGIYSARVVAMSPATAIEKPICNDVGSDAEVFAAPVAYASPEGIPLVGVNAFVEEDGVGNWTVRMAAAVDDDEDSDGKADVVELVSGNDYALVFMKCS